MFKMKRICHLIFRLLFLLDVKMSKRYSQGFRSKKILCLIEERDPPEPISLNDYPPATSESGSLNLTPLICTKKIEIDNHERVLLEDQLSYTNVYKKIKSLSLSDLTMDTQDKLIKCTKRSRSAPSAYEISGLYEQVGPLFQEAYNVRDGYEYSEAQTIDESRTDCETSDDEYGNMSEGRKRRHVSRKEEWKKNQAQNKRMRGEEYLGYTKPRNEKLRQNRPRVSRQLGDACVSQFCRKSKFRGCQELDEDTRKSIHAYFWEKLDWGQKKVYVASLVNRTTTTHKTKGQESRRLGTLNYFLPQKKDGSKIQVCKQMFLNTLSLKSTTVQTWAKNAGFEQDKANQDDSQEGEIKRNPKIVVLENFLKNLPKMPSHYARKDTRKLYLEPNYRSVSDVFNAYKQYCSSTKYNPPVSRYTFDKVFNDQNLSLFTLKKDMCDVCVGHEEGNIDGHTYQEHLIKKNRAREEKERDKKDAALGNCTLLTMDLEAVKVCPYSTASALYFKTKLTCHNFTLNDLTSRHCTCYWFTETAADLTASTFASFVTDYLERHCLPLKRPIIIYSDGCTYQNRNVILANALMNFCKKHNITIIQKFLERGHTQMECDSVHSAIERKLINRVIHLPCDYVSATKEARASCPYEVVQIDHNFVKNYADSSNWLYKSIRPGRKVGDPTVTDIRGILYDKSQDTIQVKLHFDQDWFDLPQRHKPFNPDVSYSPLRTTMIPISASKYQHLQELKQVLPSECHNFYDTLPHL